MNFTQAQLVFQDGKTLREKAVDGLPHDCAYVQSLSPQVPQQRVSIADFEAVRDAD